MIVPGKDNNYPGSASSNGWSFMPHTFVGIALALIIMLLAYHLLKGPKRVRR